MKKHYLVAFLILVLAGCVYEKNTIVVFCDERYPISFEHPKHLNSGHIINLAVGSKHYFYNIVSEEIPVGKDIDMSYWERSLDSKDYTRLSIEAELVGNNEIFIATFVNDRSEFVNDRYLFSLSYMGGAIVGNQIVRIGALQNVEVAEDVLPNLKLILGSLKIRELNSQCD